MEKKVSKTILIIMSLAFTIGIVLILSSHSIGYYIGEKAVTTPNDIRSADEYYKLIDNSICNFRIVGTILSVTGGIGSLITLTKLSES